MHDIPDALNTWDLKKRPAYLAARGGGLGETLITTPNFEQWLGESIKKTPDKLMKIEASEIVNLLKGGSAPEILIEQLKREPQFPNYQYGNFSQPFVASSHLFHLQGYDINTQKAVVLVNNLELLLQRGDYDGDLIQRYLMNLQTGGLEGEDKKLGRKEAIKALERQRLATAKTMLLAAGMNDNPAEVGLSDHLRSWGDNLYLLPEKYNQEKDMEKVLEAMIKENKGGRILFHKDIITESTSSKIHDGIINMVEMQEAESSLNSVEIFMVQKNLTPFIGAQVRNIHTWLMELDRSSTEVSLELFGKEVERLDPSRVTGKEKEVKIWLNQLGIDPDSFRRDYKYQGKNDWDILQQWHKGKQDSIDFLNTEVSGATGWASTKKSKAFLGAGNKLTHMDLFNLTFGAISQVPITKAKESGFQQYKRDFKRLMKWTAGQDINSPESEYATLQLVKELESREGRAINIARAGNATAVKAREKSIIKTYQHVANLNDYRTRTNNLATDIGTVLAGKQAMDQSIQMMRTFLGQPTIQGDMMRYLGDANLVGITTPDQLADLFLYGGDSGQQVSRAAKEKMGFTVRKATDWMMKHKWSKRASLGILAMITLDPNTNSLLLPDQRGGGEVYDWPSMNELTKSYRNRGINRTQAKLRTKQMLPSTVDKMLQETQFPKSFGTKNIISEFIPRPPNTITFNRNESYRNNPLTIQEYTRRVNGMLLH